MQITAKINQILPIQTGTSAKGEWRKQNIIVDTMTDISRKICITIWGDKINEAQLQVGNELQIDFDLESREYNGKWYTDALARNIVLTNEKKLPPIPIKEKEDDDILPF